MTITKSPVMFPNFDMFDISSTQTSASSVGADGDMFSVVKGLFSQNQFDLTSHTFGMAFLQLLTSISFPQALVLYGLYKLLELVYKEYTSPIRDLPGPKSSSWLYGNFKEIWASVRSNSYTIHEHINRPGPGCPCAARKMGSRIRTDNQILGATGGRI